MLNPQTHPGAPAAPSKCQCAAPCRKVRKARDPGFKKEYLPQMWEERNHKFLAAYAGYQKPDSGDSFRLSPEVRAKLYDESQDPKRLAAEAVAQVSVPYPTELAPAQLRPDPAWLAGVSQGSHEGEVEELLAAPGDADGRTRNKPLWPYVLWALVVPLFVLDLLLRRIALGRRRVAA